MHPSLLKAIRLGADVLVRDLMRRKGASYLVAGIAGEVAKSIVTQILKPKKR